MRSNSISDWFVRSIFRLSAVVTSLIAICMLLIRAVNPNPVCLNIESDRTDIFDPTTSRIFTIEQPTPAFNTAPITDLNQTELASAYSPNGSYLAKFTHIGRDGLRVGTLKIPLLTYSRRQLFTGDPFLSEIQWSPDGKWIAYRWKEQDNTGAFQLIAEEE
jgi:hypothetical protein